MRTKRSPDFFSDRPDSTLADDLSVSSDGDWEEARRRRDLIAPLLDGTRCPRSIVVERARAGDCATTTLYRWARLYRASGLGFGAQWNGKGT